ncbi:MAG: hypothetical protein QW424_05230 [Candidatus Bathyarchaeia archaeon]
MPRELAKTMMKRRLQRDEEAAPEAIKGEEEPRLKPPKTRKTNQHRQNIPLDKFLSEK